MTYFVRKKELGKAARMEISAPCATIIPILEQNGTRCYFNEVM